MFAERYDYTVNTGQVDLSMPNSLEDIGIYDNIVINHYRLSKEQLEDIGSHITQDGILFVCGFGYKHRVDSRIRLEDLIQPSDFEGIRKSFELVRYIENEEVRGFLSLISFVRCRELCFGVKGVIALDTYHVISSDGAKIAYTVSGSGPALLLVHGVGRNKSMWVSRGWIDILKNHFTAVAVDIRGHGESDKAYEPGFYSIENILRDFELVIKECGFNEYSYFGHSYGATLGLQACKYKKKIRKMVCAGTSFGDHFFKSDVPKWISEYEEINLKKKSGRLNESGLSDEEMKWAESNDLDLSIAQLRAMNKWQGVEVEDIDIPLAIYTGTKDNPLAVESLSLNEDKMQQRNIRYKVFDKLNHVELVSSIGVVSPWVLDFLL